MALTPEDFTLTQAQLQTINAYAQQQAQALAQAGEDLEFAQLSVRFEYTAVLGRSVYVAFGSGSPELEIESCL